MRNEVKKVVVFCEKVEDFRAKLAVFWTTVACSSRSEGEEWVKSGMWACDTGARQQTMAERGARKEGARTENAPCRGNLWRKGAEITKK